MKTYTEEEIKIIQNIYKRAKTFLIDNQEVTMEQFIKSLESEAQRVIKVPDYINYRDYQDAVEKEVIKYLSSFIIHTKKILKHRYDITLKGKDDMTYIFANIYYRDYREVGEEEAKEIINRYNLKLNGVTYMNTNHPDIMVWEKRHTLGLKKRKLKGKERE